MNAHLMHSSALPNSEALARSKMAGSDARDVFPWTRTNISDPEESLRVANSLTVSAEEIARVEAARISELEMLAHSEIARREFAEQQMKNEYARRTAIEELVLTEVALRKSLEDLARTEIARREIAEAAIASEANLRRAAEEATLSEVALRISVEDLARTEIARREIAEAVVASEANLRRAAEETALSEITLRKHTEANNVAEILELKAVEQLLVTRIEDYRLKFERVSGELVISRGQLETILTSTFWRASSPLRSVVKKLPRSLRSSIRSILRHVLWALRFRIPPPASKPNPSSSNAISHNGKATVSRTDMKLSLNKGFFSKVNNAVLFKAIERLKRLPLFSTADYLRLNPDVGTSGMSVFNHAICYGSLEGRQLFSRPHMARLIGKSLASPINVSEAIERDQEFGKNDPVVRQLLKEIGDIGIFVSSQGNVFMREISDDLAKSLYEIGASVSVLDEFSSIDSRPQTCVFLAPHEFFTLGQGKEWLRDDLLAKSFMFGTEQLQTSWFSRSLPFLLMSRGVIDMCFQTEELLKASVPTLHFLPRCEAPSDELMDEDRLHPLFRVLPSKARLPSSAETAFTERPIDITFFGTESPYRQKFFARHAGFLSDFNAFLYLRPIHHGPIKSNGTDASLTRLADHVSAWSKILLNIHRDEVGYFEWHRMVRQGMRRGSVVVSDPCLPHPLFRPGEHYFEERPRHIPNLIEWLLRSQDGLRAAERVRQNANDILFNAAHSHSSALKLLRFLARPKELGI